MSDAKVALDQVYSQARELAAAYQDASSLVEDQRLAGVFGELARSRAELARALRRCTRSEDSRDPPKEPDPDWIQLAKAGRHVMAALSSESRTSESLVRARLEDEDALADALACALDQDLAPETLRAAHHWRGTVDEARTRLRDAHRHRDHDHA